ncbi:MAG: phosphotransferase family protein [Spirochaetales bacterium]|nr:phosphotransferase family protein [Spirochaetales bacterium]
MPDRAADEKLLSQLELYLSQRLEGSVFLSGLQSLSGGACQENFAVDVEVKSGPAQGRYEAVFRTDKGAALFASLSRAHEFQVCRLAFEAFVKTPEPFWLETNASITGSPFYFMRRIAGKAQGRFLVKDPSLNQIRPRLAQDLAQNLARIHSIGPEHCQDAELRQILAWDQDLSTLDSARSQVQTLRGSLAQMPGAHPAMELILNWLEKNAASSDRLVLVHGDFRTGNFMVNPEGLQGIVDWEFAHWGDRHEDLTWLCLRDWRFGKTKLEAGGFADRAVFYSAYEEASGIRLDQRKILYWEVMGNLRWAIGCLGQADRHLSGKDKGIELAAIGRRACEMEWEAMRLIEKAAGLAKEN